MTPQQKLLHAAALIEQAIAALDEQPGVCAGCQRTHYGNWSAHQALDALTPMPEKLRRTACNNRAFDGGASAPKLQLA